MIRPNSAIFRLEIQCQRKNYLSDPNVGVQGRGRDIDYQLDALIIIYSLNNILLYMFRASSAHLQEDTVVHVQHMVLSLP